jgi:hypothetical protein
MKIARRKLKDKYLVLSMSSSTLKALLAFQSMDLFLDRDRENPAFKPDVTVGTVKHRQKFRGPG